MTWSTSRSIGTGIALPASMTRSTSSLEISRPRPVTATTPRELMPSMWRPEMPANTDWTSRPDMSSAASTASSDRAHGRLDVDHDAPAQAARRDLADPDDLEAARFVGLPDDRADLRGPDVKTDYQIIRRHFSILLYRAVR